MTKLPPTPEVLEQETRGKKPQIAPVHAQLLEQVEQLRAVAAPIIAKIRKHPTVRPDSPEAVYLRYIGHALNDAAWALEGVRKFGGTMEIQLHQTPDMGNAHRIVHRFPLPKVVDLKEYRERRQAMAS